MTAPSTELPTNWKKWILGARPRTLPAAVAPVVVGTALAYGRSGVFRWWAALCALGVALCIQIATNYANDYSDGKRGTDDPNERSGPPRLVGNGLATPAEVKRAVIISFGLTLAFGVPLVIFVNWWLIIVGVIAVAAGWFYTGGPRPYGYAGFGEVFVFVFFGLVATVGSSYVQTETVELVYIGAGVAMGLWATALLVINNLRDIPGDTRVGKRTLAVRLGDENTRGFYVFLIVGSYILLPFITGAAGLVYASLAFVSLFWARLPVVAVLSGARGPALIPVLGQTSRAQLIYALILSGGYILS